MRRQGAAKVQIVGQVLGTGSVGREQVPPLQRRTIDRHACLLNVREYGVC